MKFWRLKPILFGVVILLFLGGGYYWLNWSGTLFFSQGEYVNNTINIESWQDGETKQEELDLAWLASGGAAGEYIYLSPPYLWQGEFNALGVMWQEQLPADTTLEMWVRSGDHRVWGEWLYIWPDADDPSTMAENKASGYEAGRVYLPQGFSRVSDLLPIARGHDRLQYRVKLTSQKSGVTPKLERLRFELIKAPSKKISASLFLRNRLLAIASAAGFRIIARSEWGVDESLRVFKTGNPAPVIEQIKDDDRQRFVDELKVVRTVTHNERGERLTWPLEYPERVRRLVVHHTAGLQNPPDSAAYMQSLYYWHTVTKGWGDLGYNYVIDKDGNIFEGRAGGDGVVAAHAGLANTGSVGIAVLGNYEDDYLTPEAKVALTRLLQEKAAIFGLDPMEKNSFRGLINYVAVGHRDVDNTRCPGEHLYAALPEIRLLASEGLRGGGILNREQSIREAYQAKQLPDNPQQVSLAAGGQTEVRLRFRNTGTATWDKRSFLVRTENDGLIFMGAQGSKVAQVQEVEVPPGQVGTFLLKIQAGSELNGLQSLKLVPVINELYSLYSDVAELNVVVQGTGMPLTGGRWEPDYRAELVKQSEVDLFFDPYQVKELWLEVRNVGLASWPAESIVLGTWGPRERDSVFRDLTWLQAGRVVKLTQALAPGEVGRIGFQFTAPGEEGEFLEKFNLVVGDNKWLLAVPVQFHVTVQKRRNITRADVMSARVVQANEDAVILGVAYPYPILSDKSERRLTPAYQAKVIASSPRSLLMVPGEQQTAWLEVENTGTATWVKPRLRLATSNPPDRDSMFADETWLKRGRVVAGEQEVASDGRLKFTFSLTAPREPGIYQEYFMPLLEGVAWLNGAEVMWEIRVSESGTTASSAAPVAVMSQAQDETAIRVEIGFESQEVQVSASGNYEIQAAGLPPAVVDGRATLLRSRGDKIEFTSPTQGAVLLPGPVRLVAKDDAILKVDNWENRPAWNPRLNDNLYRGILEVRRLGRKLLVINELPLEQYLLGIAEVPNDEPLEKQKTIAVLARSYAYFYARNGGKHPERGSTVNSSGDDQVYKGYNFELRAPSFKRAVKETRGVVVTYQGQVVKAPFFNQSDGRTRSWEEVWGGAGHPYAQSVPDPYCQGLQRNGHGVGVSGCGAKGMAEHGKNYQEILNYYFQGIELKKLY